MRLFVFLLIPFTFFTQTHHNTSPLTAVSLFSMSLFLFCLLVQFTLEKKVFIFQTKRMFVCSVAYFAESWDCRLLKTFGLPLKIKKWRPLLHICTVPVFADLIFIDLVESFGWKLVRSFIHVVRHEKLHIIIQSYTQQEGKQKGVGYSPWHRSECYKEWDPSPALYGIISPARTVGWPQPHNNAAYFPSWSSRLRLLFLG